MPTPFVEFIARRIGKSAAEVFELNQMLLQQEERAAQLHACHVKQGSFTCTLPAGHKCQHIAHNLIGNIVGRWDF